MEQHTDRMHEFYTVSNRIDEFARKVAPLFIRNEWTWSGGVKDAKGPTIPGFTDIAVQTGVLMDALRRELRNDPSMTHACVSSGRIQCRYASYDYPNKKQVHRFHLEIVPENIL